MTCSFSPAPSGALHGLSHRRRLAWPALLVLLTLLVAPAMRASAQVFDYATGARATRMWMPPNLDVVKGVVIFGNGAGADFRGAIALPWLRQFAQVHDFALIATSMWGNISTTSEFNTWNSHLAALGALSAHPELVNAPWAPFGLSNGGQMSYGFNVHRPDKTIAFVTNKGCCYASRLPAAASLATPGILISGELDTVERHNSIKGLFDDNRPRGGLWSWAEQQGKAHEDFADEMILPFMAEAIRLRYPSDQAPTATQGVNLLPVNESDGWLADQSTWKSGPTKIADYADYTGDKRKAGWLLNENIAAVYRAFSTYDRGVRLDFADVPFDPWPYGAFFSDQTPALVNLKLDLSGVADWTKIELLNYAQTVLTLTPDSSPDAVRVFDAPIPRPGVYAFSALVTRADGTTQVVSNPLAFTAIPEPAGLVLLAHAWAGFLAVQRVFSRRSQSRRGA